MSLNPPALPNPVTLTQLRTGRIAPLGPAGVPSGIDKARRHGALRIGIEGLAGDEQGDRRHHGGPEKALHHYAAEHYPRWRRELPSVAPGLRPGGFGENLVAHGWTEADLCVGDVVALGSALLQVSQARQPCWRLNLRFGVPDMALRVQRTLRTGWYYRVLEPGTATAGDRLCVVERPHPAWTLHRLLTVLYVDRLDAEALEGMAAIPALARSWRQVARTRLARGRVEGWARRLHGEEATERDDALP